MEIADSKKPKIGRPSKSSKAETDLRRLQRQAPDSELLDAHTFKQKFILVMLNDIKKHMKNALSMSTEAGADAYKSTEGVDGMTAMQLRLILMGCFRDIHHDFGQRLLGVERWLQQHGVLPREGMTVTEDEQKNLLRFIDADEYTLANANLTFKCTRQLSLVWARLSGEKRTSYWEQDSDAE